MEKDNKQNPESSSSAEDKGSKKKLSRKMVRIILIVLLAFGGVTGGLVASIGITGLTGLLSSEKTPESDAEKSEHEATDGESGSEEVNAENRIDETTGVLSFDGVVVNIVSTSENGRQRSKFLKTSISVIYDIEDESKIRSKELFLKDSFQDFLRQLDENEIIGTAGLIRLKSELLKRAKAVTESEKIKEILISELIVQ